MFAQIDETGRRDIARRFLDAAELWLRNTIDRQFRTDFGESYFSFSLPNGDPVVPKKIRDYVATRRAQEPGRFAREIDATTLGHCTTLIAHPNHYDARFKAALSAAYPHGNEEARTFLTRLEIIRNKAAHGGNISTRELERAVCYSNDLIDSLKGFFVSQNSQRLYNVPTIVRMVDSQGNDFQPSEIEKAIGMAPKHDQLQIGQTLLIEVEVDATFDASEYEIEWSIAFGGSIGKGSRLQLEIKLEHVSEMMIIACQVTSKKVWHRKGTYDDRWQMFYKVLPPVD